MKCTCKQCGRTFELTPSEISFYKRKKLRLPKRCKECRDENKKNSEIKEDGNTENKLKKEVLPEKSYINKENYNEEIVNMNNNEKYAGGKKKGVKKYIVSAIAALVVVVGGITGVLNGNAFNTADDITDNSGNEPAVYESVGTEAPQSQVLFRTEKLREEHFKKHGVEMGFSSAEAYEKAAAKVVADKNSLHKLEAEDGDDVYYLERTNEFVIVSTDGYLRTYFNPNDGIEYFNRQ